MDCQPNDVPDLSYSSPTCTRTCWWPHIVAYRVLTSLGADLHAKHCIDAVPLHVDCIPA